MIHHHPGYREVWQGYPIHKGRGHRLDPFVALYYEERILSRRVTLDGFDISLVYHPGWDIEHPGERDGEVFRL